MVPHAMSYVFLVYSIAVASTMQVDLLSTYQRLVPEVSLADSLESFLPHIVNVPREAIENCFESSLNNSNVNLFERGLRIFDLLYHYYESLPSKKVTSKSVRSLIKSVKEIADHVVECARKPKSYKLGFTSMSDRSDDEFQSSWGVSNPGRLFESNANPSECYPPDSFQAPAYINWQYYGIVTPVKNQGACGSCYAFAVNAAIESAYLRQRKVRYINLSEQQLVDCISSTGCVGGNSFLTYNYIKSNGVTSTANYPYTANPGTCYGPMPKVSKIRGRCIRGRNYYAPTLWPERPTDLDIKKAVAYHGPITICISAKSLKNYKRGYFDDPRCSPYINHMVLLVGYTSQGWILKNSWGRQWGDNGYFRVVSGKNMCGVNYEISYPLI